MLFRRNVRERSASWSSASWRKARPRRSIGGVDLDLLAGLGVFQRDDPNVRQRALTFIVDLDGNEIVPPSADGERLRKIRRLKIGDKEDDRAARHDLVQIIERQSRLGATA